MFKIGYTIFALAFSIGLFGMFYWQNYFRKIVSFAVFSSSAIMLFVTIAYKHGSIASFQPSDAPSFTDPMPSVLMLTAIVVGISVQAIALSLYLSFSDEKKA